MGNVYEKGAKESLKTLSNLRVGVKLAGYATNGLGYVGAGIEASDGNYGSAVLEAGSTYTSYKIGAAFGWVYGLGWSAGWEGGRSLSTTEMYNRVLFGTGSYIYQNRERIHGWRTPKTLD